MCEAPISLTIKERTARKQHICDECGRHIHAGDRYSCADGLWGPGEAYTFRLCLNCKMWQDRANDAVQYLEELPAYGGLAQWWMDADGTDIRNPAPEKE